MDLDVATEFLLIAATLIELKTRRLLPSSDDGDLDDELAIWEERDLLLARLLECKTFKDAASAMRGIAEDAALSFARTAGPDERYHDLVPDILAGVVPNDLRRAFLTAIEPEAGGAGRHRAHSPYQGFGHRRGQRVDGGASDTRSNLISRPDQFNPRAARDRDSVLAVLELFKSGHVELEQLTNFGEIVIQWVGEGEDRPLELAVDTYEG